MGQAARRLRIVLDRVRDDSEGPACLDWNGRSQCIVVIEGVQRVRDSSLRAL